MKIFHIMMGAGNGGAETYAADMIIALQQAGLTQQAVLHAHQSRLVDVTQADVAVTALQPSWFFGRWRYSHAIQAAIQKFAPNLIHCWMRRAASLMPTHLTQPVIGWYGGYYDAKHFRVCSHFIGVTPDIVVHQRKSNIHPEKCFFVPTFPVLAQPHRQISTPPRPEDKTILLTLSRLHPKKGLDTLLAAMRELPECVLWLAGDGPEEARLKQLAQSYALRERVHFLGWRDDRGTLLAAADLCLLPSRYEPFGTVMLEAWAAGTALIAAAAAGPAAFVKDGENGLLIQPDDPQALAQAIRRLVTDAALRAKLIAGGTRSYETQFTRPAVTQRMLTVYQEILRQGR
jgi:glycosyltransferase involved in cell wall biosynthesis